MEKQHSKEIKKLVCFRINPAKFLAEDCEFINQNVAISSCWLNPLLDLHHNSINVFFLDGLCCLFLRMASSLDAFSSYPSRRSCAASH